MSTKPIMSVWSEGGDVFCMENGDYAPHDMEINIHNENNHDELLYDLHDLESAGYEIKIGRPPYLSSDWQIEMCFKSGDDHAN